jgi:type IV secretion system protein VirD4
MVKVYDPNIYLRKSQNFTISALLYIGVLLFICFLSLLLTIFLVEGSSKLLTIFSLDPFSQVKVFAQTYLYYIKVLIVNISIIDFVSYNFFFPKIIAGIFLLPILTISLLAWKFWDFIITFEPIQKEASVHGDAHWANEREIIKAGLRSKKGVLMGENSRGFLVADGYQHTLLFAPTGSGKGVGFVIPNMLFWEESLIVHDIKLENFEKSSGWRKNHLKQDIFCWVPADQNGISHCYNPLDWISRKPGQMVDDVQKISAILLPKQEFWTNEARTLLVGIILFLLADDNKPKSFGEVVRTIRSDDFSYLCAVALDTLGDKMHPVGYMNIAAFLQKADKERSGVVSTLNSGLELWGNPIIDATTCKSDFNFMDFKIKPTTVYVGLTPDNIHRLKPLMGMFYQQATAFMSQHMPLPEEKYGVLFLMDEFPTVGKLEQFLSGIAYFRGYKVRLFLVVQDTQQLKGTYEDTGMNSFLSNSTFRITFAANNVETAKLISELIGNQTVEQDSFSRSQFLDLNANSGSVSISQTQRALLLPQEVITMARDEQIILIEANPPVKTKKIFYFKNKIFTSRLLPQIELPKQEPILKKNESMKKDKKGGGGLPS